MYHNLESLPPSAFRYMMLAPVSRVLLPLLLWKKKRSLVPCLNLQLETHVGIFFTVSLDYFYSYKNDIFHFFAMNIIKITTWN
jgi:hypothetical protein